MIKERLNPGGINLGQFQGCLSIRHVTLGLSHRSLKEHWVDLGDDLACLHLGIKIGEKLLDITRDLAAYLDIDHRIERAGRGHKLRDRPARHIRGQISRDAALRASANDEQNDEEGDDDDADREKALHEGEI